MENYSFFDAELVDGGYDREYSSEDMAKYFSSFIGNGVYANPANSLQVTATTGLNLNVAVGKAFINGYYYELTDTPKTLTLNHGDSVNPRYDLIVLSLNLSKRLVELKVLNGAAAVNPTIPAITRSDTQYDLVLAQILVAAGATEITQENITDTRFDNSLCGIVSGVVNQIETTGLFSQYEDAFNKWFTTTKGSLSGDVAGNLSNQISATNESIEKLNTDINELTNRVTPLANGGTGASTAQAALNNLGISWGTAAAPATGTPNTIYIQLL